MDSVTWLETVAAPAYIAVLMQAYYYKSTGRLAINDDEMEIFLDGFKFVCLTLWMTLFALRIRLK